MPIIGLSDQGASFPRIGILRKGAPKPETGNKPGRDLDHFRFDSTDQTAIDAFRAAYGDEPDSINVFLPFNSTDENFESWVESWTAGSLQWRGDGEQLVIWQKTDGTYSREPKPQPKNEGKETGRLKVIIPELRRLAYVVALTTSIHDIMELSANLRAYEALRGSLQGIPFVLSRVPRMVSTPGQGGKRVRREKWLLHIEAAPQWVQGQLAVMKRQALPGADDLLALESGEMVHTDTGEIVAETAEWGELEGATENGNEPPVDSRGEASPQVQAARRKQEKEATKDNGIDWKAKAIGQKFQPFASCLVNAEVGYKSVPHVENKLAELGENFSEDDTERLWDVLVSVKESAAA